jgi:hypothetical protein
MGSRPLVAANQSNIFAQGVGEQPAEIRAFEAHALAGGLVPLRVVFRHEGHNDPGPVAQAHSVADPYGFAGAVIPGGWHGYRAGDGV